MKKLILVTPDKVLTVPMRNGNGIVAGNHEQRTWSSYRTYEEWKLMWVIFIGSCFHRSYRTYEEWKHECILTLTEK